MEKLKKHDHSMTDKLKGLIFSIVMLAPFIAVAISSLIMIYNEGAITGYTGNPTEVFYDSLAELGNQPIFNWTTSTLLYTTINNMCTQLEYGTATNTIALLLTYWTLNTAVYVIFDIIIECFKYLTHSIMGAK